MGKQILGEQGKQDIQVDYNSSPGKLFSFATFLCNWENTAVVVAHLEIHYMCGIDTSKDGKASPLTSLGKPQDLDRR